MRRLLAVGTIRRAHGTEGWVRVACFEPDAHHLRNLHQAALAEDATPRDVERVRVVPGGLLLKLRDVDTRHQAASLAGCVLWVDREMASPLREGEYYAGDLCGCVVLRGAHTVGKVTALVEGGATGLLEVTGTDGVRFLVPFLEQYVGEVSVERGTLELKEAFEIEAVRPAPGTR